MSDALQYLTPMIGNKPKFLFLLSILCGPAQLDQPYSPTMMLQDNDDFLEVLKLSLWDKLDLQSCNDEDHVVSSILNYLQTGGGPEEQYNVSITYSVEATSHEVAYEKFVAILHEKFNGANESFVHLTSKNLRLDDNSKSTVDLFSN